MQILKIKKQGVKKYKDIKFISNKLYTKKAIYKIIKTELVNIIYKKIHCNCLILFKGYTTAQVIQSAI